jgi:hypothetical protein
MPILSNSFCQNYPRVEQTPRMHNQCTDSKFIQWHPVQSQSRLATFHMHADSRYQNSYDSIFKVNYLFVYQHKERLQFIKIHHTYSYLMCALLLELWFKSKFSYVFIMVDYSTLTVKGWLKLIQDPMAEQFILTLSTKPSHLKTPLKWCFFHNALPLDVGIWTVIAF